MSTRMKAIVYGLAAGALIGAVFGWIVGDGEETASRSVTVGGLSALTPGDYLKVGISVLTLAREFNSMVRKS